MAAVVSLLNPRDISPNKENPRLIFRENELESLKESIDQQGILVPLTVFEKGDKFIILDGERRWRCALRLNLKTVPTIIQPEPDKLQNIMMMFAIHNARKDWDPLPTALKLEELENQLARRYKKAPTEADLASAASISRGEVRRYRQILAIPDDLRAELMEELEKPRHEQILTVDHVLETTRGVEQLQKKGAIGESQGKKLTHAIIKKFREKTENSTVAPRLLPKIARAYERRDVDKEEVQDVVKRLIQETTYTIAKAYSALAVDAEESRRIESNAATLHRKIEEHLRSRRRLSPEAKESLRSLAEFILSKLVK
jgi:ParB family chromosome partitioning protein